MTDTPYLTRARETLRRLFPKGSPFAQNDLAEKLAAEFAQVRNEALEEAAEKASAFPARSHGNLPTSPVDCAEQVAGEISSAIRSLKEPRQ